MAEKAPATVKIKYREMLSGPNEIHRIGDIDEVDEATAARYIEKGIAERIA